MTLPENPRPQQSAWVRVALIAWLLLISGAVVINHVTLSKLVEHSTGKASTVAVTLLDQRVAELVAWVAEQDQQQPTVLSEARYESEHQVQNQRLAALEQALGERATVNDVQSLQQRIELLKTRPAAIQPPTPSTVSRPRVIPPKPAEPPFQVAGIELRSGEQFLSILPIGSTTLAQVYLLRPGETVRGWRLAAIEGASAVFQKDNQTRRMAIPAHQEKP